MNNEVAPMLFVRAAPNKLRVKIGVARVADSLGIFLCVVDDGLMLGGQDILPLGVVVLEGFDGLSSWWSFCHRYIP